METQSARFFIRDRADQIDRNGAPLTILALQQMIFEPAEFGFVRNISKRVSRQQAGTRMGHVTR